MKKFLYILVSATLAASLWACGMKGSDPHRLLHEAELSLQAFDFDQARAIAESLDSTAAMEPSLLCRQALIYAALAEACDSPDDMNVALRCYERAYQESPDSVKAFAASLPLDSRSAFTMIEELHHAIANPVPPSDLDEMMDSIISESEEIHP